MTVLIGVKSPELPPFIRSFVRGPTGAHLVWVMDHPMYPPLFQGMGPLVVPQGQDCSSPYKLTDKAMGWKPGDGVGFFLRCIFFFKKGHALFR